MINKLTQIGLDFSLDLYNFNIDERLVSTVERIVRLNIVSQPIYTIIYRNICHPFTVSMKRNISEIIYAEGNVI